MLPPNCRSELELKETLGCDDMKDEVTSPSGTCSGCRIATEMSVIG